MRIIGHRGAAGHAPENTCASFERALRLGADWIECDVQICDGRIVVIHDVTVDRTTNGTGPVAGFTFDALRRLDAGNGEQIPTLEEVLDLAVGRMGVNIELKGPGTVVPVVKELQKWCLGRDTSKAQFLLSSFAHHRLRRTYRIDLDLPLATLVDRHLSFPLLRTLRLHAGACNPPLARITKRFVRRAHLAGLEVYVYTVNEPSDITRMSACGVDGIFSDFPDRVRSVVSRAGRSVGDTHVA